MNKIGIDFGGTKIEGILLDKNFDVIKRKRVSTPYNYNSILHTIRDLIFNLKIESNDLTTIGIGIPGTYSSKTGIITHSNTPCIIGKHFQKNLEDLIDQKILIENDANCFALSESKMGAGKNFNIVLGIIIGTGVGSGIVIDGKILNGKNNFSGEWGHHSIFPDGKLCYCGRRGCLDQYISGPSLEQNWTELTGKIVSLPNIIQNIVGDEALEW